MSASGIDSILDYGPTDRPIPILSIEPIHDFQYDDLTLYASDIPASENDSATASLTTTGPSAFDDEEKGERNYLDRRTGLFYPDPNRMACDASSAELDEEFTVFVGQDKVFTECNYHAAWFMDDPNSPLPWPEEREASSEGNRAYSHLAATPGHAGQALAFVGVEFLWNTSPHDWEDVITWPVNVTIDLSYNIDAYWDGNGSANAWAQVADTGTIIDWIGYQYPPRLPGNRSDVVSKTYSYTIGELGGLIHILAQCQAGLSAEGTGTHTSSSEVQINSIKIEFINSISINEELSDVWVDPYSSEPDDKEAEIWYEIKPDYFSGQLAVEIEDWKGNKYEWDKGLINITEAEGKISWDGCINGESVNQANNTYYITLILLDGEREVARSEMQKIWVGRPVILLHGIFSTADEISNDYIYRNLSESFEVFAVEYDGGKIGSTTGDIRRFAKKLDDEIELTKRDTGAKKVDIVAHSQGGLVARWRIQKFGKTDVGKLIMIGTANHGADFAKLIILLLNLNETLPANSALVEQIPHSPFLNQLNNNNYCSYYIETGVSYDDEISESCHYIVISNYLINTLSHKHIYIFGKDYKVSQRSYGDGIVPFSSAILSGANIKHATPDHAKQPKSPEVTEKVRNLLQQPDELIQHNSILHEVYQLDTDSLPAYWTTPIEDIISPGEVKSYNITVDPSSTEAHFLVVWDNGTLNVTLSAPNGTGIGMPSEDFYAAYSIQDPEQGNWTVEISPISIPTNGTNVTIQSFIENPLFIGVGTEKTVFDPQEPIKITAYLGDNESGFANALVLARISKPDNTTETLTLYDDGSHNDNQTQDGIYANEYTNTSLWGTYYILILASGNVDSDDFLRETFTTVWVELYPDLTLDSSDISFSKNRPVPGENITISARIRNIGDADAANSSIFFYQGGPATGVLIGEDVINLGAGQTALAYASWSAADEGQHKIQVLVSPFNEFMESNYSNNDAFRFIDVTSKQSKIPNRQIRSTRIGMVIKS